MNQGDKTTTNEKEQLCSDYLSYSSCDEFRDKSFNASNKYAPS